MRVNPNARANDFVLSNSRNLRLLVVVIVSSGVGGRYGIGYYACRVQRLGVGRPSKGIALERSLRPG